MIMPGHTPGCTNWLMNVRGSSGDERKGFFHCSSSVGGQTLVPESYPGMVSDYRRGFERVAPMQADVFRLQVSFSAGSDGFCAQTFQNERPPSKRLKLAAHVEY